MQNFLNKNAEISNRFCKMEKKLCCRKGCKEVGLQVEQMAVQMQKILQQRGWVQKQ